MTDSGNQQRVGKIIRDSDLDLLTGYGYSVSECRYKNIMINL